MIENTIFFIIFVLFLLNLVLDYSNCTFSIRTFCPVIAYQISVCGVKVAKNTVTPNFLCILQEKVLEVNNVRKQSWFSCLCNFWTSPNHLTRKTHYRHWCHCNPAWNVLCPVIHHCYNVITGISRGHMSTIKGCVALCFYW